MNSSKRTSRRGAVVGVALAVTASIAPASTPAATPRLVATVGPGFTIALKTPAGKKVTTLKPGAYAVTIDDRSAIHDFRLRGPGLNKVLSSVSAVGKRTVTVRLGTGRYQFACQPHAAAMRGGFTVG